MQCKFNAYTNFMRRETKLCPKLKRGLRESVVEKFCRLTENKFNTTSARSCSKVLETFLKIGLNLSFQNLVCVKLKVNSFFNSLKHNSFGK